MAYTNYVPQLMPFHLEPDNNSMSSNSSYYNSLYSSTNPFISTPFQRKGGRRPNKTNDLTREEEGKVKERRERNKLAAARCRKRRVDHTSELNDEVEDLEIKRQDLQSQIQDLEAQKNDLLLILNDHQSQCKIQPELAIFPGTTFDNKYDEQQASVTELDIKFRPDTVLVDFEIPVLRELSSLSSLALHTAVSHSQYGQVFRSSSSFNFESLMEGGTGLTPQNSFKDCENINQ